MTMRIVLLLSCTLLTTMLAPSLRGAEADSPDKLWVFVGTYSGGASKGIYRAELELSSGKLSAPVLAAESTNPSFLAIHPSNKFLYAVSEISAVGKKSTGAVRGFALDPATGELKALNQQETGGAGPCHLVVDKAGKNVLAANYGGGSACVLPIGAHGMLGEATAFKQHVGSSVDKGRQEGPHAHSINLDAANRFAFVADLGLDRVMSYRFDPEHGTLTANEPPFTEIDKGAGPRHFAFHPNGKYGYVINEMSLTVTSMNYDAHHGCLRPFQTITTLPEGADRKGASTAEVQVHPSGKFLYGSNRGHNTIAIFTIDQETGKLTAAGHQGKGIKTPRNFGIDPTGKFMLVASQDGDSLSVFRIDQQTGDLKPTESVVKVPKPVCVKMIAIAK